MPWLINQSECVRRCVYSVMHRWVCVCVHLCSTEYTIFSKKFVTASVFVLCPVELSGTDLVLQSSRLLLDDLSQKQQICLCNSKEDFMLVERNKEIYIYIYKKLELDQN